MAYATSTRSIPELFRDLGANFANLARTEGQLARAEISEKTNQIASGLALMVGGAVVLIPGLVILLNAIVIAMIDGGVDPTLAAIIVGGVTLLIGIVLLAVGFSRLRAKQLMPERTMSQLQQDAAVAKHQMRQENDVQRAA